MKAPEHRQAIYEYIGGLLGRDLTPTEHTELRERMIAMTEAQTKPLKHDLSVKQLRIQSMAESLYRMGTKHGKIDAELAFLRASFAVISLNEPDNET